MRLLIGLAIVGAMLFGADLFLRTVTETRAENQMESVLDLRNKPDVTLGGWPFVIKALAGDFPSISLEIANERVKGVELSNISLELRDVELDLGSLLSESSEAVRMGGGEGTASLTEDALARAFARRGLEGDVSLNADGSVTVSDDRLPRPVDGTMTLDGSSIVLAADGVPRSYSIPLPPLIQGLSYDSLTVSRDSAELHFSLAPGRLRAPRI